VKEFFAQQMKLPTNGDDSVILQNVGDYIDSVDETETERIDNCQEK